MAAGHGGHGREGPRAGPRAVGSAAPATVAPAGTGPAADRGGTAATRMPPRPRRTRAGRTWEGRTRTIPLDVGAPARRGSCVAPFRVRRGRNSVRRSGGARAWPSGYGGTGTPYADTAEAEPPCAGHGGGRNPVRGHGNILRVPRGAGGGAATRTASGGPHRNDPLPVGTAARWARRHDGARAWPSGYGGTGTPYADTAEAGPPCAGHGGGRNPVRGHGNILRVPRGAGGGAAARTASGEPHRNDPLPVGTAARWARRHDGARAWPSGYGGTGTPYAGAAEAGPPCAGHGGGRNPVRGRGNVLRVPRGAGGGAAARTGPGHAGPAAPRGRAAVRLRVRARRP